MSEPKESELDDSDVTVWLDQLKDESNSDAIEKIWRRYYSHLITYARKKLGTVPLRDFDEEDIVTDALDEFFNDVRRERFPQLADRNDLWRILLVLTLRKVLQNIRFNRAAKRGGGQVRGDSVFISGTGKAGFDNLSAPPLDFEEEVAEKLGVSERTVERKLERIRAIWNKPLTSSPQ